jgi:ubiquinone biosynthesis monooxygenase Coq7
MNEATPETPASPEMTGEGRLPGDPTRQQILERIIRVDQAGEAGASRIYAGQLAVLGHTSAAESIRHMGDQEREHLATFNALMIERRVRPTLLSPLWHVAGFALGAGTALMGARAAMACTVAVEEAIDEHYANQAASLGNDEASLRETILAVRADEIEHQDIARDAGAEQAPGYVVLHGAIKTGTRIAIWLTERI